MLSSVSVLAFVVGSIAANRRRGGGGGGSPPPSALAMGFNFSDQQWTSQNLYWQDQAHGSAWSYVDGSNVEHVIPAAYLDSDNWPIGMPAGAVFLSKAITGIPTDLSKTLNVTYDGVIASVVDWQSTHSGFTSGTGTVVADNFMNAGLPPAFRYTIAPAHYAISLGGDGNYPRNIHIRPAGTTSAEFDPLTAAQIDAVISGGAARFMDATGVNFNGGPDVGGGSIFEDPWGGGTQASPAWKIDTADLNSYTSGQWTESHASGTKRNAGYPISALVNFCNARHLHLHYNVNWNMSPAAQAAIADYIVANLDPALKAYIEVGNEVWNFGFPVASQSRDEAKPMNRTGGTGIPVMGDPSSLTTNSSGGSGERYCEKVREVMAVFSARWALVSGGKPTLRRCLAIQHAGGGGTAATFLDYMPDGATAVKTFVDCLMTAPYFDPFEVNPATYSGTYLQIIADLYKATDLVVARCTAIKAACDARSIEYAFYEYGPSLYTGSGQLTLSQSIHRAPEMKTWLKYTLQRTLGAVGSAVTSFYGFCGAIGTNFGTWEVLEYAHQDATSVPKYQAVKDHVNGIHSLVPLAGPMIAKTGASVGALVGIVRRRNPGSTVTLSDPKLSFVDATAQELHVQIADATIAATDGTTAISFTETDARDPASPSVTSINLLRTSNCVWLPNGSAHIAEFDISADGLTVTRYTGTGGDKQIFGSVKRGNGCVEFVPTRITGNVVVGFANDSHSLTDFIGGNSNSFGWYSNGGFQMNGGSVSPWPSWDATNKPFIYISASGKAYGTKDGGTTWYPSGSDPVADTGGVNVSSAISTGVRPAMDIVGLGTVIGGHFTTATYTITKPAGSSEWVAGGGAGDVTPPILSLPSGFGSSSSTGDLSVTTDEDNGVLYWVVTTSSTTPTKAQVKAGQNAAGSAANASGNQTIGSSGTKTATATGLSASTTYYAHFMHEDAAANQSNVVSSTSWATTAPGVSPVTFVVAAGVDRHADTTLSGSNLTITTDGTGLSKFASATRGTTQAGAFEFEFNIAAVGEPCVGIYNGDTDFSVANVQPGSGDTNGISFQWFSGAWYILRSGGVSQGPFASASPAVSGKITVKGNKSGGTLGFYRDGVQIGVNETGISLTDWVAFAGGRGATNSLAANFAGPFAYGTDPAY